MNDPKELANKLRCALSEVMRCKTALERQGYTINLLLAEGAIGAAHITKTVEEKL